MANFQNVGTTNAGIFQMNSLPGGAAGGIPTMDAAAIQSGNAFLTSELEKRDPLIRKPLSSVTYPRDIPIKVGGGWVDYVSAMSVAYGVAGGSGSSAVHGGGATGIPVVQASVSKGAFKAHVFASALRILFVDMQRANGIGRSLDQLLQDGIRLAYDKHMDQNVYAGFDEYSTTGLTNNPDVTETTAATTGTGSSTKWADKSPKQILTDINNAINAVWAANDYDEDAIPNHILIPYEQYAYITTTMVSDLGTETIYDFLKKHNVAANHGVDLVIAPTRWVKGVGTSGNDRMVVYVNKERFIKMDELVPLSRVMSAPNVTNVCYDTAYMANTSEVQLMYQTSMLYVDGI